MGGLREKNAQQWIQAIIVKWVSNVNLQDYLLRQQKACRPHPFASDLALLIPRDSAAMGFVPFKLKEWQSKFETTVIFNLADSGCHPAELNALLSSPSDHEKLLNLSMHYPPVGKTDTIPVPCYDSLNSVSITLCQRPPVEQAAGRYYSHQCQWSTDSRPA